MYDNLSFMEDLHIWIASLSSSNLRSFRHIATLVWLTIMTKLCDLYVDASKSANQHQNIIDTNSQRARSNKAILKKAQSAVELANTKKQFLEMAMDDIFKTIFAHRYRDVDPRIRIECMRELGVWMESLPIVFFDSKYIRYFGWLLSDINAHTRIQVIKSLTALYKIRDNISEFRHFTDRFKLRMIEIAVLDSDTNVRVATIDLLCVLREVGFLASQDIEVCSRLVFDSEPRVRKAASRFLLGHAVEEATGRSENEFSKRELNTFSKNFPELDNSWLIFKEISYMLRAEGNENENDDDDEETAALKKAKRFETFFQDLKDLYPTYSSRISLAGEALWEVGIASNVKWTDLVSLLLFDFSSLTSKATNSSSKNYINMFALDPEDVRVLLELLYGLVNGNIKELSRNQLVSASTMSNMRKKKMTSEEIEANQTAVHAELISALPQLLDTYLHSPESIALIVRLYPLINLDVYRQLHLESKHTDLINNVANQFKSNSNKQLLEECANAFSKTIKNDTLIVFKEEVESKIKELVEDVGFELKQILQEISESSTEKMTIDETADRILDPVLHLDALSRVIDIQVCLEQDVSLKDSDSDSTSGTTKSTLVEQLTKFLSRYSRHEPSMVDLSLLLALVNLLRSYSMWKLSNVVTAATHAATTPNSFLSPIDLSSKSVGYLLTILETLQSTVEYSDNYTSREDQEQQYHMRSVAAKALLDLFVTINVTLAQVSALATSASVLETSLEDIEKMNIFKLPHSMSKELEDVVMGIFLEKEKAYAKSAKVKLEKGNKDKEWEKSLEQVSGSRSKKNSDDENDKEDDENDDDDEKKDESDDNEDEDDELSTQPTASQKLMSTVLGHDNILKITDAESRKQQALLLLDCDLCQYTAKLRMAALAKVVMMENVRRIKLNASVLSPLYMKIVSVSIVAGSGGVVNNTAEKTRGKKKNVASGKDKKEEEDKEKEKEEGEDEDEEKEKNEEDEKEKEDKDGVVDSDVEMEGGEPDEKEDKGQDDDDVTKEKDQEEETKEDSEKQDNIDLELEMELAADDE